jgi:hypothetical protein
LLRRHLHAGGEVHMTLRNAINLGIGRRIRVSGVNVRTLRFTIALA